MIGNTPKEIALTAEVEALRVQLERCKDELVEATHPEFGSSWRGEWERAEAAEARVAEMLDGEMKLSRRVEAAEAQAEIDNKDLREHVKELSQDLHRAHTAMDILLDRIEEEDK